MVFLVVILISQLASCMLVKHPLRYGVCAPALRFVLGMWQTTMVEGLAVTIYHTNEIGL